MKRVVRRVLVALSAVFIVGLAPIAHVDAAAGRSTVSGSKPSWAQPSAKSGARASGEQLQFRVYLNGPDDAGAEAAALDASNPSSPNYRHWLTADQVRARFGPTTQTVNRARQWLTDGGFTVVDVATNRLYIEVSGTVAQAQQAFGVQLGTYNVRGRHLRAPDRDLSVPSDVASLVSGVLGLDESQRLMTPAVVPPSQDGAGADGTPSSGAPSRSQAGPKTVPPPDGFRNGQPCSQFWAQQLDTTDPAYGGGFPAPPPYAPCGYKPGQLRSAYGLDTVVDGGNRGQGVTVAIIDAFVSPTLFDDAHHYADVNDPAYPLRKSQFSELVFPTNHGLEPPDKCDAAGWYGEQTLDVEAVHAIAPGANILYVGASDCNDVPLDRALNTVVGQHLAQIVSNSYGNLGEDISPSSVKSFHKIVVNAALEGIGVYFSSGDNGDEKSTLGVATADFPASDPMVTAVGGSSLGVGSNGHTVLETGWETGKSILKPSNRWSPPAPGAFLYGSGGGTSVLYDEPAYQVGVVPTVLAHQNHSGGATGRVVPDISMDGDPNTGMLIGETQTFPDGVYYDQYRIGGTSLSCPLFAGLMALADHADNSAHGFINPSLYPLAGTSAVTDIDHLSASDVRVDFLNGVDGVDGTITSTRTFDFRALRIKSAPGYDNVTGIGVPNGVNFLNSI